MTERKLLQELTKQIKRECPSVTWEKLGDSFGGYKRLDVFAFWKKHGVIIEFKIQGNALEVEQLEYLKNASSSACCYVASFFMPEGANHCRSVRFQPIGPDGIIEGEAYYLHWERGQYKGLRGLLPALLALDFVVSHPATTLTYPNTIEK